MSTLHVTRVSLQATLKKDDLSKVAVVVTGEGFNVVDVITSEPVQMLNIKSLR